jgi:hypothetical protein
MHVPEETRARGRIATLAAALTAVMLIVSACAGGSTKTQVLRLRSANPLTSDLYVRVRGPAGAVSYIAQGLTRGAFSQGSAGDFVPPSFKQQRACSFSHTIDTTDPANLQAWLGSKVRISVYGSSAYAATYCRGIRAGVFESHS